MNNRRKSPEDPVVTPNRIEADSGDVRQLPPTERLPQRPPAEINPNTMSNMDTYGPTMIKLLHKEELATQFGFGKAPNFLSLKMKVLLAAIMITWISLLTILVIWLKNVRSMTFNFELLQSNDVNAEDHPTDVLESHQPKLGLIHNHVLFEVIVFVAIMPVVLIIGIVGSATPSLLTELIVFAFKLAAAALFYIGFQSSVEEDLSKDRRDFSVHQIFGYMTVAISTGKKSFIMFNLSFLIKGGNLPIFNRILCYLNDSSRALHLPSGAPHPDSGRLVQDADQRELPQSN